MRKYKSTKTDAEPSNAKRNLFGIASKTAENGKENGLSAASSLTNKQYGNRSTEKYQSAQKGFLGYHREESCYCRYKDETGAVELVEIVLFLGLIFLCIAVFYLWNVYSPLIGTGYGESDGALYIHWHTNKHLYVAGTFGCTLLSLLVALLCGGFSWMLVYFDSERPGVHPPTPLSPTKIRTESGHTFHLLYITPLLNGACILFYSLWRLRHIYIIEQEQQR